VLVSWETGFWTDVRAAAALRGAGVEEEREFGHGECYLAALPVAKRKWAKADADATSPLRPARRRALLPFRPRSG